MATGSRGNSTSVITAAANTTTASATATGLPKKTRRSRDARRGKVVMGKVVAAPDTINSPITAAYVVRHSGQYIFNRTNDMYPRYSTTASAIVDRTKR